jgi:hypothetical protein
MTLSGLPMTIVLFFSFENIIHQISIHWRKMLKEDFWHDI